MTCDKIKVIRDRLKIAQDRQKSYVNNRRRNLEFEVGDMVFLRISPWKGVLRFGKRGKLSPRNIGPYRIVERIGEVAYRLELPSDLDRIHDVFHVSMLRKYIPDPSHVLTEQPVEIQENLTYEEELVHILDRREQVLRNKTISLVKVLWRSHTVEEATWEHEDQMKRHYPHLFDAGTNVLISRTKCPIEGGFVTSRSRDRCTVHLIVGAYPSTKCHTVVFWRGIMKS